jgi:hypothetical protein
MRVLNQAEVQAVSAGAQAAAVPAGTSSTSAFQANLKELFNLPFALIFYFGVRLFYPGAAL